MVHVVLMCGSAGAGKTTVARRLAAEGYVRLSIDEAAWERGYRDHPLPADIDQELKRELQDRLVRSVEAGRDVVVDLSFWARRSRDEYRRILAPLGVIPEVYYLATPLEVMLERVARRDNSGPSSIALSPAVVEQYAANVEVPTETEGPLRVFAYEPPGT